MRGVMRQALTVPTNMADPNQADFPGPAPVVERPAADVRAPRVGEGNQVTYTFPIRQPEEDFNDFQVGIRASLLRRCRGRLGAIADQGFPLSELLLGVSTLAAGGTLSAIVSGVALGSWQGALFFALLPAISVGCGVAYGMLRHFTLRATQQVAADILEDLPNPDRAIDVRRE